MQEEFLHYVWRTKNFAFTALRTTQGETIQIIDFGVMNHDGGPDFKHCKIRIGSTIWAGNVEMHLASSDWERHGHSEDPAYESVILHVVLEEDVPVVLHGRRIPCIEMRGLIPGALLSRYSRLLTLEPWVPCEKLLPDVEDIVVESWLERMLIVRLESNTELFTAQRKRASGDWAEAYYVVLCRAFGFRSNGDPMQRLAERLPLKVVRSVSDDPVAVESLFFGAAGMLNRIFSDKYAAELKRSFDHLSIKFGIKPMDPRAWQWGRQRPANFPTMRIAQFAAFVQKVVSPVGQSLRSEDLPALRKVFDIQTSNYWQTHTDLDRTGKRTSGKLGRSSVDTILVNTVLPFLFLYGKYRNDRELIDRAMYFFKQLPPELNSITKGWEAIGVDNSSAGRSQGLLHLKRTYCDRQRCTVCSIGNSILTNSRSANV